MYAIGLWCPRPHRQQNDDTIIQYLNTLSETTVRPRVRRESSGHTPIRSCGGRFTAWHRSLPIKTSRTTSILFPMTVTASYACTHRSGKYAKINSCTLQVFFFIKYVRFPSPPGSESHARVADELLRRGLSVRSRVEKNLVPCQPVNLINTSLRIVNNTRATRIPYYMQW